MARKQSSPAQPPSAPRRKWLIIGILAAVSAGVLLVAGWWWRASARQALLSASVPVRPELSRFPAELTRRIDGAEERVRQGAGAAAALAEIATLYHANGCTPQAIQAYGALMSAEPSNPRWPHRLATLYAGEGELDTAIALWQRVLQIDARYTPARLRLGDCQLKANRPDEAAKIYTAVLSTEPSNPYALVSLARLDLQSGQAGRARERLELAVQASSFAIGGDLLATAYEQLGDRERAEGVRARSKSSGAYFDPPDPWVDEIFADCFDPFRLAVAGGMADHGGDGATARRLLDRAIELAPTDGQLLLQYAMMEIRGRDYAGARRHLERAAEVAPQLSDVWAQLVVLHGATGDQAAAERALATGLVHCPNSPGLRLEYGRQLVAAGRTDEAVAAFRESFRLRPEEAGPLIEMAKLLLRQERIEEGVAELRHALAVEPEYPTALTTLALYAIGTGDEAAARAWLRRVELQVRIPREDLAGMREQFLQRFGHAPGP